MLRIAVCDDEKEYREKLSAQIQMYMQKIDREYELFEYESGEQLLEQRENLHILLLDIFMHQKNGIQAGTEIKRYNPDIIIIYITNLNDKISVAMNLIHSFGYLVKPVKQRELYSILNDAFERLNVLEKKYKVMFCKKDGRPIVLVVKDIYYFEYYNRKIKIVTKDKIFDNVKGKIGDIAVRMQPYGFILSHQSFVVNLNYINSIKDGLLVMENGDKVCLAQKRASAVRKSMMTIAKEFMCEERRRDGRERIER